MADKISIGIAGAWKDVGEGGKNISIGVGGAWKTVSDAWIGVGGVWKKLYTQVVVALTNISISDVEVTSPTPSCSITYGRDGNITVTGNASASPVATEWADPDSATVGDAFHVKLEETTGVAPNGASDVSATWLALTSDRTWIRETATGTDSATWTVSISDDGGSTTLDSHVVTVFNELIP